jgi:hypothetical protein
VHKWRFYGGLIMVDNKAIVKVISRITKNNGAPCKKTLQKIVFLIEAKHVDLGCDYGIHFYGPYSADLDFAVRELNDEGILKIDYTPMEHLISVVGDSFENGNINPTVNEVIDEFSKETPSELELIATALYVYLQVKDVSRIKTEVIKIKGSKYSGSRIDSAIGRLKATGYIVE